MAKQEFVLDNDYGEYTVMPDKWQFYDPTKLTADQRVIVEQLHDLLVPKVWTPVATSGLRFSNYQLPTEPNERAMAVVFHTETPPNPYELDLTSAVRPGLARKAISFQTQTTTDKSSKPYRRLIMDTCKLGIHPPTPQEVTPAFVHELTSSTESVTFLSIRPVRKFLWLDPFFPNGEAANALVLDVRFTNQLPEIQELVAAQQKMIKQMCSTQNAMQTQINEHTAVIERLVLEKRQSESKE